MALGRLKVDFIVSLEEGYRRNVNAIWERAVLKCGRRHRVFCTKRSSDLDDDGRSEVKDSKQALRMR